MRSPALALAWEFRQRHRLALIVFLGYVLVLGMVRVFFLGPDSLTLDRPSGVAAAVVVPLGTTFLYLLAVFSFGLDGDMAARQSIFPARMFTLPVSSAALAGWPMLLGSAAVAGLWLSGALLARWSWGIVLPLIWPALMGAVFLAWTQVLTWNAYGLPGLRIVVSVLWLVSLDAAVFLAVEYKLSEPRLVALLLPQLPLAYLAAWLAVGRARRGEVPNWVGVFARTSRVPGAVSPRRGRFPSAERAQLWFEWRREGWILPLAVGILLPFELGLLDLASDEPRVLVFGTLLAVLLTPPFMAGFAGAIAGRSGRDESDSHGATFTATRPLTSAALVAAKLRMALWSTLLAWLLVVASVPLGLSLTDTWPLVVEGIARVGEVVGQPRAIVVALLAIAGLLASTWKQLVQSLCIHLTGRAWVVRTNLLVRLSFLIVLIPVADWIFESRRRLAVLWDTWPWILAVLVCLKMCAAGWVASRLHRSRLLSNGALVAAAASWLAMVLALYGVLVWLVSTPPILGRYIPLLFAILAVPLARLSAAPLCLAARRHRGARPGHESAAPARNSTLAVVRVLIGLPVALLLLEAVSWALWNRSNGTLVSSGEEREYLLYVPRSYDSAKPTPLVISLHGGAMWPAAQRDTSEWNRVADRHGFIVVYPAGIGGWGRGPRAWHMSRSGVAKNVRFISDLIDALKAAYNIDSTRVYADGLSNGGGMAFVLSCAMSDRIAAVGLVASAQLLPFEWCTSERAVPMIAFHGTADRATPYHGGTSWVAPNAPFPEIPGWTADWARRNRCGSNPAESAAAPDVTRLEYAGCADDAAVVLYTVEGGGHSWPGGGPLPEWLVGPTNRNIDASSLMWAFYRDHRLPPRTRSSQPRRSTPEVSSRRP
jgi:polyhydroxybutyrate depolymerase